MGIPLTQTSTPVRHASQGQIGLGKPLCLVLNRLNPMSGSPIIHLPFHSAREDFICRLFQLLNGTRDDTTTSISMLCSILTFYVYVVGTAHGILELGVAEHSRF